MRVLGISPLDKDATVSFVEDGRVRFACGEERLSRVKLQDGFPHRALRLGLERTRWDLKSIDAVAYAFFDGTEEARLMRAAFAQDRNRHDRRCTTASQRALKEASKSGRTVDRTIEIPGLPTFASEFMSAKSWYKRLLYRVAAGSPSFDWWTHRRMFAHWVNEAAADHDRWTQELDAGLEQYGLKGKLRRFHHHDTHAANAFFASGFKRALLVCFDGYGSGAAGGIYTGGPDGIKLLQRMPFPNSLGHFYEHVTSGLGFKPNRHEGKIVGLAAYGDPQRLRRVLLERFVCADGDLCMRGALNAWFTRALAGRFAKRDIAAAYQRVLEEVACITVEYWLKKTGQNCLAVSGGVHANVKLNQRLREINGVDSIFVYPNMGDGGCATGAAMLAFDQRVFDREPLANVYHGPDYSDAEMAAALRRADLAFETHEDIESEIARLLTEDCIVGRFAGRMEYGPRALGNRSILYPAREPEVNQWLNHQLGRTEFMPFAPAALAEHASELFKNLEGSEKTAEFMTLTFDCTERMKRECPAAVHVDGTARPQLVSVQTNPSFHRILLSYHERTGISALINTSFNMHEEPIVCSPEDAIRAFLLGNIDYLAMGPFLAPHPKLAQNTQDRQRTGRAFQLAAV